MSPNPVTDQWMVSTGIRGGHKIRPVHWLVRFLVNLGQDRINSVIWIFIFELTFPNFKIDFIQNSFIQNSKMTKIKKTLGRNWTRYHNYYGMTHILERACSKKLHWNRETIREYTVSHASEVNYEMAKQHVDDPPPLPENDDDDRYRWHPKLPGSGKAPLSSSSQRSRRRRARQKVA